MRLSSALQDNPTPFSTRFTNRLDQYRTYSFYHFWGVTANTEKASKYFAADTIGKTINAQNHKLPGGVRLPVEDGVYLLINGVKDLDFVITRLETTATAQAQVIHPGSNTCTNLTGEMTIREPQGIRFLNVYRQIYSNLNALNHDIVNVLKTVFVGWKDNGDIDYITDIPPIFFSIQQISISASTEGSTYAITFIHLMGLPISKSLATNATGVLIPNGGNVRDSLHAIADQYTKSAVKNSEKQILKTKSAVYKIQLHDSIKNVGDWSVTEQRLSRTEGANNRNPISVHGNLPIDYAIAKVFAACKQYNEQAITKDANSFLYKIVATTNNTDSTFEVLYMIIADPIGVRYETNIRVQQTEQQNNSADIADIITADDRVLIYDYIFTGRNTDIERFDMKIDEGLAFLNAITITENYQHDNSVPLQQIHAIQPGAESSVLCAKEIPEGTCSGPGRVSGIIVDKNHPMAALKAKYDEVVREWGAIEAQKQGIVMQIRGNPGYISCFAVDPAAVVAGSTEVGALYVDLPMLYINIMMPTHQSSIESGSSKPSRYDPEFERYWYQGVWSLTNIKCIFEGGKYTNELSIMAMPKLAKTKLNSTDINSDQSTGGETKGQAHTDSYTKPSSPEDDAVPPSRDVKSSSTMPQNSTKRTKFPVVSPNNGKHLFGVVSADTQITPNFKYGDMLVTTKKIANTPPSQEIVDNIIHTLEQLQLIRDKLQCTLKISSGYRCLKLDLKVGGTGGKSSHVQGLAVDFTAPNFMTPKELVSQIAKMGIPFRQMILEVPKSSPRGWVHIAFSRAPGGNHGDIRKYTGGKSYPPYKPG